MLGQLNGQPALRIRRPLNLAHKPLQMITVVPASYPVLLEHILHELVEVAAGVELEEFGVVGGEVRGDELFDGGWDFANHAD